MQKNQQTPPNPNEIEVSLFGPGKGEALALHLGQGKWMLVDSCRKKQNTPVHLEYLQNLGVNVWEAVDLIVITHWHTDHIEGLNDVVKECANATISLPESLSKDEFLSLANLGIPSGIKQKSGLGSVDFSM